MRDYINYMLHYMQPQSLKCSITCYFDPLHAQSSFSQAAAATTRIQRSPAMRGWRARGWRDRRARGQQSIFYWIYFDGQCSIVRR